MDIGKLNYPILNCLYCLSSNTYVVQLRKNISLTKPIYKCENCKRRFTPDNGFKKFRYSPTTIKTALELLKKETSLGDVAIYLNHTFKVNITRKTIFDWKKRFLNN